MPESSTGIRRESLCNLPEVCLLLRYNYNLSLQHVIALPDFSSRGDHLYTPLRGGEPARFSAARMYRVLSLSRLSNLLTYFFNVFIWSCEQFPGQMFCAIPCSMLFVQSLQVGDISLYYIPSPHRKSLIRFMALPYQRYHPP